MNEMEIIGLAGKSGVGKDFVGRELLRPAGYQQWAFAWPLKQAAVGQGLATYAEVHHTKPPHVRRALQVIGTQEGWRKFGRMYWCDTAGAWLETMREQWGVTRFYFTDVRFPHEAEWVRARGGRLIRLEHGDRPYPLAGTPAAEHESETALDDWTDWDARIVNDQMMCPYQLQQRLERAGVLLPTHDLVGTVIGQ